MQRHLTQEDLQRAAARMGCDVAAVQAIASVESSGEGFLPDGRPVILYEAHIFGRVTGYKYATRDSRGKPISSRTWDRSLYGPTGDHQWNRMRIAEALNRDAAWKACSWGMFQVLGENHRAAGFPTVEAFVQAMESGAGAHLDAAVGFILTNGLAGHLRNRAWAAFARGYNGPGFAANQYDTKLAAAYQAAGGQG
ncbi:peptidoglycan-binding protein [Pseudoroseomonas rhizosphaerae]|uniref:Peptidoglycan-binding protein n=1 Tax=Teichococcus rhizosphaerae TaxID=1335062 RepID=A0A2C7A8M2_9PROT|nr:peptidoglycan-binding protein [Pseudoroseomonas rhizosphaerae]